MPVMLRLIKFYLLENLKKNTLDFLFNIGSVYTYIFQKANVTNDKQVIIECNLVIFRRLDHIFLQMLQGVRDVKCMTN